MIKCLHNICMILLLNEKYDSSSDLPDLGFNPSFEYVYKELSNIESFRHENGLSITRYGCIEDV